MEKNESWSGAENLEAETLYIHKDGRDVILDVKSGEIREGKPVYKLSAEGVEIIEINPSQRDS